LIYWQPEASVWYSAIQAPFAPMFRHCSVEGAKNPDTRQQCDALAELMVTHGTSLLDLGVGKAIGAHVEWPKARLDALSTEQQALMQAIVEVTPWDDDNPWSCKSVDRLNAYMTERTSRGELGVAHGVMDRSGETPEVLAQRWVQHIANLQREATKKQQADSELEP